MCVYVCMYICAAQSAARGAACERKGVDARVNPRMLVATVHVVGLTYLSVFRVNPMRDAWPSATQTKWFRGSGSPVHVHKCSTCRQTPGTCSSATGYLISDIYI